MPKRAFTLLELLVVLFLIALASAMIFPRIGTFFHLPERSFPQKFSALLLRSQKLSLIEGKSNLLLFRPEEREIWLLIPPYLQQRPFKRLKVPERFEVKGEDLIQIDHYQGIVFFGYGGSSGGVIELIDRESGRRYLFKIPKVLSFVVPSS